MTSHTLPHYAIDGTNEAFYFCRPVMDKNATLQELKIESASSTNMIDRERYLFDVKRYLFDVMSNSTSRCLAI